MSADTPFDRVLEAIRAHIVAFGFEPVDLRRTGTLNRPIFQVRVDCPDSRPGHGVTVEDCARISRSPEPVLEASGRIGSRYALEVSSPGAGFHGRAEGRASPGHATETGESDGRID